MSSECDSLESGAELWATSSGTPMPRPSCWRGWKTRPWSQRLFGAAICRSSTAVRFVQWWTSSQRGFLASPSRAPASSGAPRMIAGSGPISSGSFAKYDPDSCSWRTCQGSLLTPEGSEPYSDRWPISGSMRNGACCQRPESEPRTCAAGCSYSRGEYPTPAATPYGSSNNEGQVPHDRQTRGTPSLGTWASRWPKATADNSRGRRGRTHPTGQPSSESDPTSPPLFPTSRAEIVRAWQTPKADQAGSGFRSGSRATESMLKAQAGNWQTPRAASKGPSGPMKGTAVSPPSGSLNPRFVEWLMGFPIGWTEQEPIESIDFDAWETAWCLRLRRLLS